MNRRAKGFRTAGSLIILLNIVLFFLPMAQYDPENYPTERFSQLNYMLNVFSKEMPYETAYTTGRILWLFFLIILPLLISITAGVWGLVGDDRQNVSSIMIFVAFGLYIGLFMSIGGLFPEKDFSRDFAGYGNLTVSVIASVIALLALLSGDTGLEEPIIADIPQIKEMKQEQIQAKYNIIQEADSSSALSKPQLNEQRKRQESVSIPPYVPGPPKGVMVGLTGIYAGAEIPFKIGESIRLGRLANNDLVFEGQDKVSRNHCYIRWDGHKFMIKDSSSNGVFVNGSEDCLPQNIEIEIPVGSVIAIGDENNTFRLE